MDNNFAFDGKHCLHDYDCIYVRSGSRTISAPQTVMSYTIGGVDGDIAYGDHQTRETYNLTGVLYAMHDLPSETEAQRLWRELAKWLMVGRRKLVMDVEPDRYIIAEVAQLDYDTYDWVDGGMQVTWLCQPCYYALVPYALTVDGVGTYKAGKLAVDTDLPAPVSVSVTNTGTAVIRSVTITVGGRTTKASKDMYLTAGQTLRVDMEPPVGATIVAADGTETDAMACMTQYSPLEAVTGTAYSVNVSYGTGTTQTCKVSLQARGKWR